MKTVLTVPCGSTPLSEIPTRRPLSTMGYHDFLDPLPSTILLVEDNPAHADLAMRSFENHPLTGQIVHLTDGEQALDYLFRRDAYADPKKSPRPCMILLDLRLPKMSGLDVLQVIKTTDHLKNIPVVILTTSDSERDARRAYERYANSYVVKPMDFTAFGELIEQLGWYWLRWNHNL